MLNEDEQETLNETERRLTHDDPGLAGRLRRGSRRCWPYTVAIVTSVALAVGLAWLTLPGHALLMTVIAGVLVALRRNRHGVQKR